MTALTLDPADAATASRPLVLVETRKAVGGRIDAIFFCPCNFSFAHGADYDRCPRDARVQHHRR